MYWNGFQQFFMFSRFMGKCSLAKLNSLVIFFSISGSMGMLFRFFRIFGSMLFEHFSRLLIDRWYFYDLNGLAPYLGNSSYPLGKAGPSLI